MLVRPRRRGVSLRCRLALAASAGALVALPAVAPGTGQGIGPGTGSAAAAEAGPAGRPVGAEPVVPQPDGPAHPAEAAAPPDYDAPLLVTIDAMTPGALGDRGAVRVRGEVVNRDVVPWEGISIYPFFNPGQPMTTAAEVAAAAETEPDAVVGERITDVSDTVDELLPGEVASYSIRVPRELLETSAPGVYWFGVHALGASEEVPDDIFADGRARSFLPFVPDAVRGSVEAAVVVPLRRRIVHTASGAVARRESWRNALDDQGNLGRLLSFGSAALGRPVTWLVDPALPDALQQLARGNPPRSLGPTRPAEEEPGDPPTGSPGSDPSSQPDGDAEEEAVQPEDPTADAAQEWLDGLEDLLRGEEVLTLPYGDLDVAAAAEHAPTLYGTARELRSRQLEEWGVDPRPAVASPSGYLDAAGLRLVRSGEVVLLTDQMFVGDEHPDGPPAVAEHDGTAIAVTSSTAGLGGPGPDPRLAPVALRQRVLAEAAVRLVGDGPPEPLVVVLPQRVDPVGAGEFWAGLDADWLDLTTVEDVVDRRRTPVDPATLAYPDEQAQLELGAGLFAELQDLLETAETLQNVLTENDRLVDDVVAEALTSASYWVRLAPFAAVEQLSRAREWLETRLEGIRISAPPGVTLSSSTGSVPVTVTNRLDEPVTVLIHAESDDGLSVDAAEPVVLAPESRSTVVLAAHASGLGVRNVTFSLTDTEGTPLGGTDRVPIRSGQVGDVIWWILGSGAGILFVAIVARLVRRIREARRQRRGESEQGAAPAEPAEQGQPA